MIDQVSTAFQVVDHAHFCLDDLGNPLPQTSAPEVIARMLRLLEVQKGSHVLEIGTGSGFSAALLATLTGPSGTVVSIDVDSQMTERATKLLSNEMYENVLLNCANGAYGWLANAPYDRLIAWCSVTAVPQAWQEQTRREAILVVPMRDEEQMWVSKYRSKGGSLVEVERNAGRFIPLTSAPFRPWESTSR